MSKRKTMDKAQARERRNRLLESASAADLSLTDGVREMRAIAGMTQEEFGRHREVSARVIKAIELGKGNPTVATLNRIGQFFGLEVGFVPVRRAAAANGEPQPSGMTTSDPVRQMEKNEEDVMRRLFEALGAMNSAVQSLSTRDRAPEDAPREIGPADTPMRKTRKTRSP
jgi:DNA-binding XRE family transcriptional regulator